MADMSKVLQQLRQEKGITQAELAERLGVTQQHVSAIERGVRPASWEYLLAFANVVETNVLNLLRQAGLVEPARVDLEQEMAALAEQVPAFAGIFAFAREHPEKLPEVLRYARWIVAGAPEEEKERATTKPRRRPAAADS